MKQFNVKYNSRTVFKPFEMNGISIHECRFLGTILKVIVNFKNTRFFYILGKWNLFIMEICSNFIIPYNKLWVDESTICNALKERPNISSISFPFLKLFFVTVNFKIHLWHLIFYNTSPHCWKSNCWHFYLKWNNAANLPFISSELYTSLFIDRTFIT